MKTHADCFQFFRISALFLTQKNFVKIADERAVIWISPSKVVFHSGSKWPVTRNRIARANAVMPSALVDVARPMLRKFEPFLTPRDLFTVARRIDETETYGLVHDFINRTGTINDTVWFEKLSMQLDSTGVAHHKAIEMRSATEITTFLQTYVQTMVDDLAANGFDPSHTGFESTALVDADGNLCKSGSGNHRFSICKVLGTSRFPLKIVGMHEDFFANRRPQNRATVETVVDLLSEVESAHQQRDDATL